MRRAVVLAMLLGIPAFVAAQAAERPSGDAPPAGRVAVVPLHGPTDELEFHSLKRRLEDAARSSADVVVLDLDSPGGPVESSVQIAKLIADTGKPRVVAYVSGQALSGGAMAALGSPVIVMDRNTTIGAVQPIFINPGRDNPIQPAPEKAVSVVRAVMRTHAQNNGYPVAVCEAMVDPNAGLHKVTMRDGSVRYLNQADSDALQTSKEKEAIAEHRVLCPKGNLLTLTESEAVQVGLAKHVVNGRPEAIRLFSAAEATVTVLDKNAGERVLDILNAPWITGLLLLVGLGSLYFAFKLPGFGLPETLAIACFVLFFFSKAMVGKADVLEIAMFLVGLTLIGLEILVLPGFGVVGVTGILMVVVSLVLALQSFTIPRTPIEWRITFGNVAEVMVVLAVATAGFLAFGRFLPHSPALRRLVLTSVASAEAGYVAVCPDARQLVGVRGVAVTRLRPAGRAEFGVQVLDVVTEGEFIEAGDPVRVTNIGGNRIVVARA